MVLGALSALLSLEGDLQVVGQASNGRDALEGILAMLLAGTLPDVLVTDIEMPFKTGLELAAEIKTRNLALKVVILTTFGRSGYLRRALEVGARGFLLKDASSSDLAAAIRTVHAGGRAIDPALAADAWGEADPLTERERQVLRLAEAGLSSGQIAKQMKLSEGTVRNYLSEVISKLAVSNRVEAARVAREKGWL
jgi:two-component system, NarL family, response regulator DesR